MREALPGRRVARMSSTSPRLVSVRSPVIVVLFSVWRWPVSSVSSEATGCWTSCGRPSTVRRPTSRGTLIALRQGEVGTWLAYCQLFIQPIISRLPSGASFQDTAA